MCNPHTRTQQRGYGESFAKSENVQGRAALSPRVGRMRRNQGKKGWKAHASQGWTTKPKREEEK